MSAGKRSRPKGGREEEEDKERHETANERKAELQGASFNLLHSASLSTAWATVSTMRFMKSKLSGVKSLLSSQNS